MMLGEEISDGGCIELIFSIQGTSPTRCAKAKDLWTFLDNQQQYGSSTSCILLPSGPRPKSSDRSIDIGDCRRKSCPIVSAIRKHLRLASSDKMIDKDRSSAHNRWSWYDQLVLFQRLGLDKIAIIPIDDIGETRNEQELRRERKILRDEPTSFADTLSIPDCEFNNELEAFEQRVKRYHKTKMSPDQQIYRVSQKYERFLKNN